MSQPVPECGSFIAAGDVAHGLGPLAVTVITNAGVCHGTVRRRPGSGR